MLVYLCVNSREGSLPTCHRARRHPAPASRAYRVQRLRASSASGVGTAKGIRGNLCIATRGPGRRFFSAEVITTPPQRVEADGGRTHTRPLSSRPGPFKIFRLRTAARGMNLSVSSRLRSGNGTPGSNLMPSSPKCGASNCQAASDCSGKNANIERAPSPLRCSLY